MLLDIVLTIIFIIIPTVLLLLPGCCVIPVRTLLATFKYCSLLLLLVCLWRLVYVRYTYVYRQTRSAYIAPRERERERQEIVLCVAVQ